MKVLLVLLLTACLFYAFNKEQKKINGSCSLPAEQDSISFTTQIKPILVTRCSPCHFTGGKMYEKLPFDKAETITKNKDGILRRIKDEKESVLIKKFIEQEIK